MPHHDYPDEVEDPRLLAAKLSGVIRWQRIIITICIVVILALSVKLWSPG